MKRDELIDFIADCKRSFIENEGKDDRDGVLLRFTDHIFDQIVWNDENFPVNLPETIILDGETLTMRILARGTHNDYAIGYARHPKERDILHRRNRNFGQCVDDMRKLLAEKNLTQSP
jgi:hypothetical protein